MPTTRQSLRLDQILLIDAATCAAMGLVLVLTPGLVGRLTGIPQALLFWAGIGLIPVAGYMALVARHWIARPLAVWLVIAGNLGWVAGSFAAFGLIVPTPLGIAFLVGQAAVVIALTWLEHAAFRAAFRRTRLAS